jgi:hypothetical protein
MIKPTSIPDKHQYKIAVDTVRNPMKGVFMGGMSEDEAIKILKTKFKYSDAEIKKLQEHRITSTRKLQESAIRKIRKVLNEELTDDDIRKLASTVSNKCGWDGDAITRVYLDALTDANFHSERRKLAPILSKVFESEYEAEG